MARNGIEQLSGRAATEHQIAVLEQRLKKGVGPKRVHRGIQLTDGTYAHDDTEEEGPLGEAARKRREEALERQTEALARRSLNSGSEKPGL